MFGIKKKKQRVADMSIAEREAMIKRLERERNKINSEIESILQSYSKESGNKALLKKKRGRFSAGGWDFSDEI